MNFISYRFPATRTQLLTSEVVEGESSSDDIHDCSIVTTNFTCHDGRQCPQSKAAVTTWQQLRDCKEWGYMSCGPQTHKPLLLENAPISYNPASSKDA